jgi:hypothetical protein
LAIDSPYRNPEQEAEQSNAGIPVIPNRDCSKQAVEGKGISGEVVETIIASRSLGVNFA